MEIPLLSLLVSDKKVCNPILVGKHKKRKINSIATKRDYYCRKMQDAILWNRKKYLLFGMPRKFSPWEPEQWVEPNKALGKTAWGRANSLLGSEILTFVLNTGQTSQQIKVKECNRINQETVSEREWCSSWSRRVTVHLQELPLLLLQKTWNWIPASTWRLTTLVTQVPGEFMPSSGLQ